MPSQITRLLTGYKKALDDSEARYESLHISRAKNAKIFYNTFFKKLIKDYSIKVADAAEKRLLKKSIEQIFESDELNFAAIDGTSYKDSYGDYMVFFGASYGVRGQISFKGEPPKTRYQKWSAEQDVSMVAYVPIPFADLNDITENQFVSTDDEKLDLSFIHNQLMQLAEVYLALDLVSASTLRPKIILWDHSMSSVLASTTVWVDDIDLVGYNHRGTKLTTQDIIIAYSHPYNTEFQVPSKKKFQRYNYVLSELYRKSPQRFSEIAASIGTSKDELHNEIKKYLLDKKGGFEPIANYDSTTDEISLNNRYTDSWRYVTDLFETICYKLFKEKDQSALIYEKESEGKFKPRWTSPNDLKFLIAVGLRALIEKCWKHNVLLIGIVKDSTSSYLTRNYLGVMRYQEKYSFDDTLLPWTDRLFLETLPLADDNLNAPWATIEFDSSFMTLHLEKDEISKEMQVAGVKGSVVTPERLFARSLVQFYLNRTKSNSTASKSAPLFGHVIFVDRLLMPKIDKGKWTDLKISDPKLGEITPFSVLDNTKYNQGQDITIYLLNILTRNLFPEVIGYPDPLHKADWGAKSLLKKVKPIIESSGASLRIRPLNRTFRRIRESLRRT